MGESFVDENVEEFTSYRYRVRASSYGFLSDWSAYSTAVTIESETATVTITAPTGTINGREDIIFTTTDSAADWDDCDPPDPLPACTDTPDITVTLDGITITGATLISGTARNGTWKIKNWDTKDYANGARTLKVTMKDVNCCPAMDTQAITIDNTLSNGRLYEQPAWTRDAPLGMGYKECYVTCTSEPLDSNAWDGIGLERQLVKMLQQTGMVPMRTLLIQPLKHCREWC